MPNENTVKALVIGCVSVTFVGFIAICGVGAWFLNSVLQFPHTRPGFGIVRREGTKGEWTTYFLKDCDLRIDLKGNPYPRTATQTSWERSHISTFSRYLCTTNMDVIIFDAECKTSDPANLTTIMREFQSGVPGDRYVKNYQPVQSDVTVRDHQGKLVKASYLFHGKPMLTRFLFLSEGKRVLALRGTGIASPTGGTPNWDHVLASVVWTPRRSE